MPTQMMDLVYLDNGLSPGIINDQDGLSLAQPNVLILYFSIWSIIANTDDFVLAPLLMNMLLLLEGCISDRSLSYNNSSCY